MQPTLYRLILMTCLFTSQSVFAEYEYSINVTQNEAGNYVVKLVSANGVYYNEKVPGTFPTKAQASSAGNKALKTLIKSGVHDEPETCWYDIDWM